LGLSICLTAAAERALSESLTEKTDFSILDQVGLPDRIFSSFLHIFDMGQPARPQKKRLFWNFSKIKEIYPKNIYTQYDNFVNIFIENNC